MRCLLSLVFGLLISACVTLPVHTECQYSYEDRGAWCASTATPDDVHFIPEAALDKYVMVSLKDNQALREYVKRNCFGPK